MAIVQTQSVSKALEYGKSQYSFPIGNGNFVTIDEAFLSGNATKRLKHINVCLKAAGKDPKSKADKAWFNKNVRDGWHKALRYVNRTYMANAKPVSIGLSKRTDKTKANKGDIIHTAKFGYELVEKTKTAKLTAGASDSKPVKASKERAQRQSKKGLNNGLAKLDIVIKPDTTPTPEQTPTETVTK